VSFGLGKLSVMVTITVLARRLGPDEDEAIPVMRLIAVSSLIYSIGTNVGDVYKAVGRPGILWKLGIFNIAVLAICLVNFHVFRVVPQFSNTSTVKFSGSFSDKVIR
jgi:hypothetical protein